MSCMLIMMSTPDDCDCDGEVPMIVDEFRPFRCITCLPRAASGAQDHPGRRWLPDGDRHGRQLDDSGGNRQLAQLFHRLLPRKQVHRTVVLATAEVHVLHSELAQIQKHGVRPSEPALFR